MKRTITPALLIAGLLLAQIAPGGTLPAAAGHAPDQQVTIAAQSGFVASATGFAAPTAVTIYRLAHAGQYP
jgi:hypothetical protein